MAKKERISAQEVLETFSGFMELLDEEKLKKLDKLDDLSSIKTKQERLEKKITSMEQKMSDYVKPEDFEQKLKRRDDAFNKAIKGVPTEITVKNEPVTLDQKDRETLDEFNSQLEKRNQRFSKFCRIISDKKIWFLYIFLTAALSAGTTFLVMKDSTKEWAHRALVAAIDMNHQNPIGQYLTCRAEMSKDRKGYKSTVMAMEYDAKKILYLETILADYIDGEFCIEQYQSQQTEHLVYAAVCRFAGSNDIQVYNIHMEDSKVIEVTRRYKNTKNKRKDDPEFVWKVVNPKS